MTATVARFLTLQRKALRGLILNTTAKKQQKIL